MALFAVAMVSGFAAPAPGAGTRLVASPITWPAALTPDELASIWGQPVPVPSTDATPTGMGRSPAAAPATTTTPAATVVNAVITFARQQLGLPYQWGGNGPQHGDAGFDCSGLTQSAYAVGGVALPRTAHTEFYAGPAVAPGAPLRPGDLVFYGTPSLVHHVGLYIGREVMIHAPTFGQDVQVSHYRWPGDDYIGATRPTESLGSLGAYAPESPSRLPNGYSADSGPGRGGPGQTSGRSPSGAPAPAAPAGSTAPAVPTTPGRPGGPTPGAPPPGPGPSPAPPPLIPITIPPLPLSLPSPTPLPTLSPLFPPPGH